MKKQVKTFPSVEKFFARLFHSHCCLTCLYLDVKEKECWAPWTFEKSGCSRVSSSVEGKQDISVTTLTIQQQAMYGILEASVKHGDKDVWIKNRAGYLQKVSSQSLLSSKEEAKEKVTCGHKMTLSQFRELNPLGRWWTFFFHGQSCVNCKWLQRERCKSQVHVDSWQGSRDAIVDFSIRHYKPEENIYHTGSKCEHWELIELWNSLLKHSGIASFL